MHDDLNEHRFSTRAHDAFKQGGGRRLLAAAAVAVVGLVLVVLLGPDQEVVKRRFEYYGAPGELRIMPEVSIDDGSDAVRQLPKSLQMPPPPAEVIVEDEPDDPDAEETLPVPREGRPVEETPSEFVEDAEEANQSQVELTLPTQSNPDYFVIHIEPAVYPVAASETDRRTPVVRVVANLFLGEDGKVQHVLIQDTNGGPEYADAVREAVATWQFGWREEPKPRWFVATFNFRSPYFTPGARAR